MKRNGNHCAVEETYITPTKDTKQPTPRFWDQKGSLSVMSCPMICLLSFSRHQCLLSLSTIRSLRMHNARKLKLQQEKMVKVVRCSSLTTKKEIAVYNQGRKQFNRYDFVSPANRELKQLSDYTAHVISIQE